MLNFCLGARRVTSPYAGTIEQEYSHWQTVPRSRRASSSPQSRSAAGLAFASRDPDLPDGRQDSGRPTILFLPHRASLVTPGTDS